jgi:chromosome segregation ATPase
MNVDCVLDQITNDLMDQLKQQMAALLQEAQSRIEQLQSELQTEQQRRLAAEQQLETLQGELALERQLCAAAQADVAQIHSAIAEQLEIAEAEHEAEQAAQAEQQRHWVEQIDDLKAERDVLQGELRQERFWREQLQKRIEALRLAAVDLFGGELVRPPAPGAMAVPNSVDALLVTAGQTGREYSIPN